MPRQGRVGLRDWHIVDDDQPGISPGDRGGRLTTTIPRPVNRRASDVGRSRLGDTNRAGPKGDRISSRRSAWLFGLAALVIAGAIGAALFGLPVRNWFDQNDQIGALEHELDEMRSVNNDLQDEVDRLQTADGITEAARVELGQVQAGDERQTVLDYPDLPRTLPAGWPYTQVDQILVMRANEAAGVDVEPPADDSGDGGFQPIVTTTPPIAPSTSAPTAAPAADGATAVGTAAATSVVPATTAAASAGATTTTDAASGG